jgi:nucleoside-triphosphatase THEP1
MLSVKVVFDDVIIIDESSVGEMEKWMKNFGLLFLVFTISTC